jgi:hypothetical protein
MSGHSAILTLYHKYYKNRWKDRSSDKSGCKRNGFWKSSHSRKLQDNNPYLPEYKIIADTVSLDGGFLFDGIPHSDFILTASKRGFTRDTIRFVLSSILLR